MLYCAHNFFILLSLHTVFSQRDIITKRTDYFMKKVRLITNRNINFAEYWKEEIINDEFDKRSGFIKDIDKYF